MLFSAGGCLNLERALLKFNQPPARTEKSVQLFRNPQYSPIMNLFKTIYSPNFVRKNKYSR